MKKQIKNEKQFIAKMDRFKRKIKENGELINKLIKSNGSLKSKYWKGLRYKLQQTGGK